MNWIPQPTEEGYWWFFDPHATDALWAKAIAHLERDGDEILQSTTCGSNIVFPAQEMKALWLKADVPPDPVTAISNYAQ